MARIRWKPAKGFLVDERNTLIDEVTLDEGCPVTFPEVVAAGALLAAAPQVRVGRYIAQGLRAERLGFILVSHAPADGEQLEFVRRFLRSVQARLPSWVADRLALAQIEEARLEAERRGLSVQAAEVQARARGVAGLRDASAAVHARMAAEAAALASRAEALAKGEAVLADREGASTRREEGLGVRALELETELAQTKADADARLAEERRALDAVRSGLEARAIVADGRETDIARRLASLQADTDALAERQKAIDAFDAEWEGTVAPTRREADEAREELARQSDGVRAREAELDGSEAALAEARNALRDEEARIDRARVDLQGMQAESRERLASVDGQVARIQDDEAALAARKAALDAAEESLQTREASLAEEDGRLRKRDAEIMSREQESERFFEELAEKVAKVAKWERELAKKAQALEEREAKDEQSAPVGRAVKARH